MAVNDALDTPGSPKAPAPPSSALPPALDALKVPASNTFRAPMAPNTPAQAQATAQDQLLQYAAVDVVLLRNLHAQLQEKLKDTWYPTLIKIRVSGFPVSQHCNH